MLLNIRDYLKQGLVFTGCVVPSESQKKNEKIRFLNDGLLMTN